uniref:NXPE C-terminal domain-containing protein n=1 Tax=Branchiostoma floridae TaxID=7739 RepID=C3ZTK0_BRAFL|eukprot:XP_002588096.1 hypothetical protein BRAFLDRAFT_87614 [Branchiostoma floridae]
MAGRTHLTLCLTPACAEDILGFIRHYDFEDEVTVVSNVPCHQDQPPSPAQAPAALDGEQLQDEHPHPLKTRPVWTRTSPHHHQTNRRLSSSHRQTGWMSAENRTVMHSFPFCKPGIPHKHPEGFWLHGKWHSLSCQVRQFSPQNVTECLTNHTVHVRGDSTCRQWVERLVKWKVVQRGAGNSLIGPYTATNHSRGIMVTFNFHTLPIQTGSWFPFRNLSESGISVEVRSMAGGPNVVLVLSLCAHFVAEPKHVYSSRMIEVKLAIQELHRKYPKTKVIVKTCNTRSHRSYRSVVQQSDWLAQQIDHEMRSILGDLNVAILDVWDMTVSQWYPHNIHPNQHVQDNELNILMSYICPEMLTNIEQ